jgi:CRP/FNR family transcriptional regulator, polysaccharide utilization system transcription regulator
MLDVIDEEVRSALTKYGEKVEREKGSALFQQSKRSRGMFLVLSGKIQTRIGWSGDMLPRLAEAGSLLGVPATINGEAHSISATVTEDAELIHVSRARLLELMRNNPKVALSIIDLLSKEVRDMRRELKKAQPVRHRSAWGV